MAFAGSHSSNLHAFDVCEIDEDHLAATAGSCVFLIWRRRTTAEAFSRAVQLARRLAQQRNSKIGFCQVIEADAVPPDSLARQQFEEFLSLEVIDRSVVVHDGVGFKAASVRAIVNLQLLLSKPVFSHALFTTTREAANSLVVNVAESERRAAANDIEALLHELRALHRQRFP